MRMHVGARPEPLCLPSAGYQPAELDLRRSLDSHLAASNVIVSLLQVRKSRLRMVGSTCPGIVQLVGDAERIQTPVRMSGDCSCALTERVMAQNTLASFPFCSGTTVHIWSDASHSVLITLLEAKV